ncbi:MAG: hypothetical protein LC109_04010, partial [Bacteroidia bacterium]|nr:hypothetical protein [Bacteroidia bacterium]
GLRIKYSAIDNYLVQGANFSIAKDKRDCLHYVKTLTVVHYDCLLLEHLDGFEVTWQQRTPFGTNHKSWKYPNNSYQQNALKNIELYMQELVS